MQRSSVRNHNSASPNLPVVANLDDPSQLGMASAEFDYDEAIHTHKKEQEMVRGEEEDEIKKEKKGYDTY